MYPLQRVKEIASPGKPLLCLRQRAKLGVEKLFENSTITY
jgi:hypothetical protein